MYSLLPYNTFGIDVSAARFLEHSSIEELKKLIVQGAIVTPFLHIGGGSNLLFTKDYDELILYSRVEEIEVTEEDEHSVSVRVGTGVVWDDFITYCIEHGWYGTESLSLIPDGAGASAIQNIGVHDVEVKDLITAVETMNIQAEERIYPVEEYGYTYCNGIFKCSKNGLAFVAYARFQPSKKEHCALGHGTTRQELEKYLALTFSVVRKVVINIRESKLSGPKAMGNAGSFFMNPIVPKEKLEVLQQGYPRIPYYEPTDGRVKIPAEWMTDQCGWKGKTLGPAVVHDKQALMLVNLGGARGNDILALSDAVRAFVYEKFGTDIYPKVDLIN